MKGESISLRRLDSRHIDALYAIEQACFSHPWSRESFRYELEENPLARYYGCFVQDELIAYGGMWIIVDECHIANVAVSPQYQGFGVAKALMQRMIACALALGATMMTLEVRESNAPARGLYASFGFEQAGRRLNYYDGPKEDALLLTLELKGEMVRDHG